MLRASWCRTIEDCLAEQVELRPDATAVVDGALRLTYRDLWEQATALARGLAGLGVERETLVGMVSDRSARAIVTMAGIVLAGGAYVPLSPRYPERRIEQVVRLSGLRFLLCDKEIRVPAELLDFDEVHQAGRARTATFRTAPPLPGRSPLAHVIFTSGSTGEPKGVMIEHRGVLRLVQDTTYFDFSARQRFLHSSPLEFDAATFEVWGAVLNGATLYVADKDTVVVPSRYRKALQDHAITVAWVTAPLFHQIVDDDPGAFAPLNVLLTGGDVVSWDHVNRVREHNPGLQVANCYGPTENTTFTTVHPITTRLDSAVPIGLPIPGTTVRVSDELGQPVPTGSAGELLIGGAGLARGYLNQAELTDAKFVTVDGERLYRTGDRVRMDPNGLLHFHGRLDDQVKIRGNLVEPSEVTAALLAVPGVREVYTRSDGETADSRRLVAYIVAPDVSDSSIRTAIEATLPGYMCPEQFVRLDRLPLNSNGKVDWRMLPVPSRPSASVVDLTPAQHRLAGLWAEVLGVETGTINAGDRFTDLGGTSIRLGTLLGRIGRQLGVRLSFVDASAADSLKAMTDIVEEAATDPVPPIPAAKPGPVALHPQQRRLYAIWQANPESVAYNIPCRVVLRGSLHQARLRAAVVAMVQGRDALRMRFSLAENGIVQQAVDELTCEFEYREGSVDLSSFIRPFRLDEPPLLRALLVRVGPDRHELYLDVHHIVFDGESLRIVVREIIDRYAGVEPAMPKITYADASQWCHDQLAYAADETYWLAVLAEPPPPLTLPTDRPRGVNRATRAETTRRVLAAGERAVIEDAARQHSTTVYVIMLAAYFAVLARLSGQKDLIVGSPASGRTHPDLDNMVGMFVSTVCVRARLSPVCTFAELIRQVDERSREALSHQNYPFDRLIDRLDTVHISNRDPLLHAFFALQAVEGGSAADVELLSSGQLRFELNLQAHLRGGEIVLELEYASELFERASADYMLDQYTSVLLEPAGSPLAPAVPVYAGVAAVSQPDFDF